jgi:putative phosphoesterase
MLVGILSDSHGRFAATKAAVDALRAREAQYLIHCGDVGGEDILDLLAGEGQGAAFVFGNNDYERRELARHARSIDVTCLESFGTVSLDGKSFAVTHGDDVRFVRRVLQDQSSDYLLLGHTHLPRDERAGRVRVINPGALHRAAVKSVALLDTNADRLEFIELAL